MKDQLFNHTGYATLKRLTFSLLAILLMATRSFAGGPIDHLISDSLTANADSLSIDHLTDSLPPMAGSPEALCQANAGADQVIQRGQSWAVLNGSASTGTSYSWRLITPVDFVWKASLKNGAQAVAQSIILPYVAGGYNYELTVRGASGCVSKDTTNVTVSWGEIPPQSTGWRYATASDVSTIPNANIGDIVITGANNGAIAGGKVDIQIFNPGNVNLGPGKKILIKGGRYRSITLAFTGGHVRGTSANPVIITNYGGQVECQNFTLMDVIGVKLTGKYVPGISGDVNYQGHANGQYAFSRGKYGIFSNNCWTSLGSIGLRVLGNTTDSVEIEYMEVGNGNFAGMMIKQDNGTNDYDAFHIHDNYIHDIHSEAMYLGSTGSGVQHALRGWTIENNRIVNAGGEILQMNHQGNHNMIRNNVLINSASNWKSPFAPFQDNGIQAAYQSGDNRIMNNICLGTGMALLNYFTQVNPGAQLIQDTLHVSNNVFKWGRGAIGGYMGGTALPNVPILVDSNYFGGFEFYANQVFTDSRGINTNTLLRTATTATHMMRGNVSDGSKSTFMTGLIVLQSGNTIQAVPNPQFVNSGWPADFDFNHISSWADSVYYTWKDELPNPGGTRWKTPVVFAQGDFVEWMSKIYESRVSNNHGHMPVGITDSYWTLKTWSDGSQTYTYPPEDYRGVASDRYKVKNIGLEPNQPAPPPVPNVAPLANAGADITITLPVNTVTVSGSGTDQDGTISAYHWNKIAGPASFTVVAPASAGSAINNLVQGSYKFELVVTDDDGATGRDTMMVTVLPAINVPPVAHAGADQSITLPVNSVNLAGSGSDADGTITTYHWNKIAGPASFSIVANAAASTMVNNLVQGTYRFELVVTDNNGASAKDTLIVSVQPAVIPNNPPVSAAGNDRTITLPLNTVTVNGAGTDNDGTIAAFQWTRLSGPAGAVIVSAVNAQTVINSLVQGSYTFELKVTDNDGDTGRDTVTVNVLPAPNTPPVAHAGNNQTITLPLSIVSLAGTGTDADGTITSYQWTKISGPSTYVLVSPASANSSLISLVQGVYGFQLRVTDNNGATGLDTTFVTVLAALLPGNTPPVAHAGADLSITLPVNSITLYGSGTDSNGSVTGYQWNKISGPAASTIVTPTNAQTSINGLTAGIYRFTLTVTDNQGATGKDTVQVSVIQPPPPNVAPVVNAGNNITITLPVSSTNLNGSATDADGNVATWQWTKISGPVQSNIVSSTQAHSPLNGLVQGVYAFRLAVTDNDGATGSDTVLVTVNAAIPPPNSVPSANAGPDRTITLPVDNTTLAGSAVDYDGTIVQYAWTRISGPAAGIIATPSAAQTDINSLTQGIYTYVLIVTDNDGATDADSVRVTVLAAIPANVPPVAHAGNDLTITIPLNTVTLNGTGTDADGTITGYRWNKISGPASGVIVSPSAAQTVAHTLSAGLYQFELTVTDNRGATGRDTINVRVLSPVPNQPPVAHAGNDITIGLPVNTATLSGTATDADGIIVSYQWSRIEGPAQGSITSASSAATQLTGLVAGTYVYELLVTDDDGATARDTVTVTVVELPPAPNVLPIAITVDTASVLLPVDYYNLSSVRSYDPDGTIVSRHWTRISGPSQYSILEDSASETIVEHLTAGIYEFRVTVTDNRGGQASSILRLTVITPRAKLTVYPNPASDQITVKIDGTTHRSNSTIWIFNASGTLVYQRQVFRDQQSLLVPIDIRRLAAGFYFIKVGLEINSTETVKFVKRAG